MINAAPAVYSASAYGTVPAALSTSDLFSCLDHRLFGEFWLWLFHAEGRTFALARDLVGRESRKLRFEKALPGCRAALQALRRIASFYVTRQTNKQPATTAAAALRLLSEIPPLLAAAATPIFFLSHLLIVNFHARSRPECNTIWLRRKFFFSRLDVFHGLCILVCAFLILTFHFSSALTHFCHIYIYALLQELSKPLSFNCPSFLNSLPFSRS